MKLRRRPGTQRRDNSANSRIVRVFLAALFVGFLVTFHLAVLGWPSPVPPVVEHWVLRLAPVIPGVLLWLYEGYSWKHVLSWALPLTLVLVVADVLQPMPRLGVQLAALAIVGVLAFSGTAARWWLRLVFRYSDAELDRIP